MPEWGMLPLPVKLLKQGVREMMRISDARMSGTSYGACILHVSPEAAIGGPLALVRTGDLIEVDVEARQLNLLVAEDELARRRADWQPKPPPPRGYGRLFAAAHPAGPRGLRLRLPARHRPAARSRDPLTNRGNAMDLPVNSFKRAIKAGRQQIGLWSSLANNITVEILAGSGFDWLLLDTEHSANEPPMVHSQLQAAMGGTAPPDRAARLERRGDAQAPPRHRGADAS